MFTGRLVVVLLLVGWLSNAFAHYVWLSIDHTPAFDVVRKPDNHQDRGPVTDVNDPNFRCFTNGGGKAPRTYHVQAGQKISFNADTNLYHIGVANVYMARAPGRVIDFDGAGQVWFKVFEITAKVDPTGKTPPTYPTETMTSIAFTIPKNLPSGEYLVRIEHIALHVAEAPQFYIGCAQIAVDNGGNGTPGPLVAIPGVYNGREPGIFMNPYWPIPTSYTQPGPAVWSG